MKQTSEQLGRLFNERPWLLADGATGTELFNMGLISGDCPELWNDTNQGKIKNLYNNSINSGVDLFLTNSFGSNFSRLKLHNSEQRSYELSKKSAEIGRDVVDSLERVVIVAGSMGPTGELLDPIGKLSYKDAVEIFYTQAEGLKAGGADLLWLETISDPLEFKAAAEAIKILNMPWCGTMSFDTSGRTMMGLTTSDMTQLIDDLSHNPLAFGANCGVGSSDLLRTIIGFGKTKKPLIAKGNAGIPKYVDGKIIYDGNPELMSKYACLARDLGVKVIGGCCGTTPKHLSAMRKTLEIYTPQSIPSLNTIKQGLGDFSSEFDGNSAGTPRPRQNRRRR